jgi:hypothetical protein
MFAGNASPRQLELGPPKSSLTLSLNHNSLVHPDDFEIAKYHRHWEDLPCGVKDNAKHR